MATNVFCEGRFVFKLFHIWNTKKSGTTVYCSMLISEPWDSERICGMTVMRRFRTTVIPQPRLWNYGIVALIVCFCLLVYLFVVIKPYNSYLASRLGLEVKPLGVYPLGPRRSHSTFRPQLEFSRLNSNFC